MSFHIGRYHLEIISIFSDCQVRKRLKSEPELQIWKLDIRTNVLYLGRRKSRFYNVISFTFWRPVLYSGIAIVFLVYAAAWIGAHFRQGYWTKRRLPTIGIEKCGHSSGWKQSLKWSAKPRWPLITRNQSFAQSILFSRSRVKSLKLGC